MKEENGCINEYVWIPSEENTNFLLASVVERNEGQLFVQILDTGKTIGIDEKSCYPISPPDIGLSHRKDKSDAQPIVLEPNSRNRGSDVNDFDLKLLMKIFNYIDVVSLARCEIVCKRWRTIITKRCWPCVTRVELNNVHERSDWMVSSNNTTALRGIFQKCAKNLTHFEFTACFYFYYGSSKCCGVGMEKVDVPFFFKLALNLRRLDLCKVMVDGFWLQQIAQYLPNLVAVSLRNCIVERKESYNPIHIELKFFLEGLKKLKFLDIAVSDGNRVCSSQKVLVADLSGAFRSLPLSLEFLDYTNKCNTLDREALQNIVTRCPKLKGLGIGFLKNHEREEDLSLLKNFTEMEYLTLIGHQFDETKYSSLCDSISCMPNLKVFSVSQSNGPMNEKIIDALTENCTNLEYLHLYSFQMETIFLNCLRKFSRLSKLKILNFSASILNDEVLDEITKGTNQLERLVLGSNTLISVEGICAVLKNCKKLVELDISWCKGITRNNFSQIDSFYTTLCKEEPERLRRETVKVAYTMSERAQLLGGEQWRWEQRKDRLKQLITGWDIHLEAIRKRYQDRFCEEAKAECKMQN